MKEIYLINGEVALVDDEDFERLKYFKWFINKGYAVRWLVTRCYYMHNDVIGHGGLNEHVDHINQIKLDNRKENLRIVSRSVNAQNAKHDKNMTGFRGVSHGKNGDFSASICKNYKTYGLGTFKTAEEAASAYDVKAVELYGPLAATNFPQNLAVLS